MYKLRIPKHVGQRCNSRRQGLDLRIGDLLERSIARALQRKALEQSGKIRRRELGRGHALMILFPAFA